MKFFDRDPALEVVIEIMKKDPELAEVLKALENPELLDEFLEDWK